VLAIPDINSLSSRAIRPGSTTRPFLFPLWLPNTHHPALLADIQGNRNVRPVGGPALRAGTGFIALQAASLPIVQETRSQSEIPPIPTTTPPSTAECPHGKSDRPESTFKHHPDRTSLWYRSTIAQRK
jgi:hypothetical protein